MIREQCLMATNLPVKQRGNSVLLMTLLLLTICVVVSLYSATSFITKQKLAANDYNLAQAFAAAQAGLDLGTVYLQANTTAIVKDSNNDGLIDTYTSPTTTQVTQSDGSRYNITYSNPNAGNLAIIQIAAQGTSRDGSTSITLTHQVQVGGSGMLIAQPSALNILRGSNIGGSTLITNTPANPTATANNQYLTIRSGGSTSLSGSAKTTALVSDANANYSTMGSSANNLKADIIQNYSGYRSGDGEQFFQSIFGVPKATIQQAADLTITNTRSTNISASLNGVQGKVIWVNQSGGPATINGRTTIGSPTNPVILIISTNSNLNISGRVKLYGLLYVMGDWSNNGSGNSAIQGSLAVEGNYNTNGGLNIGYDATVFNQFGRNNTSFARIPGSWRDYS